MPSKHLQKLAFPAPALDNATAINYWKNQRKSTWLVLSGATEDIDKKVPLGCDVV